MEVTSKIQEIYQKFQILLIWIEENSYYISTRSLKETTRT
jgi:hypothetical protein